MTTHGFAGRGAAVARPRLRFRSLVGGCIGNAIEWFDFIVYSTFTVYFSPAFFPTAEPTAQLLAAVGIAAVGYVLRPLGSWLLGAYADRHGRRAALAFSVGLMCIGSLLIAVTPPYAAIGMAAPAILLVARLLQALSMGGEYGTSATYLAEMATPERRGFTLGFLQISVGTGQLGALAVLLVLQHAVLPPHAMETWGWRIPFVLGAVLALFALVMRRGIDETDSFRSVEQKHGRGTIAAMLRHWRSILFSVGITVGGGLQARGAAMKQAAAEGLLDRPDLLTDGRLRDTERGRGAREAPHIVDQAYQLHLVEVEGVGGHQGPFERDTAKTRSLITLRRQVRRSRNINIDTATL